MPSQITQEQIAQISVIKDEPILICDVDEVIVHFIAELEQFLSEQNLWLDPASFALNGNIKAVSTDEPVSTTRVGEILAQFFVERTRTMAPIAGAIESLNQLSSQMQIVLLSNLPHNAYNDRLKNMANMGLSYPLITNQGGKGPAVAALLADHQHDVFFIDDIPQYLSSVGDYCSRSQLIHFAHDQRFARHAPDIPQPHFRADNWAVVKTYILNQLKAS